MSEHEKNHENLALESPGMLREIWQFLGERKKYWLAPIIIALLILGVLIWVGGGAGALSPFLYAL